MKRKVVKQGHSTLTITLPAKWAKGHGIKAGEEVNIDEQGNNLIISSEKVEELNKIEIDVKNLDKTSINWLLAALYKRGFNEIDVLLDKPKQIEAIHKRIKDCLLGYEIIRQSEKSCTIKNISSLMENEFDNLFRRMFLVTLSMAKSSLEAVSNNKISDLKEIILLEKTNDNLANLCERILIRKGYAEYNKTAFVYVVVWQLEKIADDYKHLCEFLVENKIKPGKNLVKLYEKVNNLLEDSYSQFYKFDQNRFVDFVRKRTELIKEAHNLMEKEDKITVNYLTGITDKISNLAGLFLALNY